MKKPVSALLVLLLVAGIAQAQSHRHSVVTTNDDLTSDNCSEHLRVHGDKSQNVVRDEETQSVPAQPLTVHAKMNGGIQVTTWEGPAFSIKLCKEVAAKSDDEARKILSETKLSINGGTVSVTGFHGDGDYSLGTLIMIKAPRGANVNLSAQHGGVALADFSGTAEAHVMNGGISLKKATGKFNVASRNGGISIRDSGGDITAVVENGGLSIRLPQHWDGKGIDARTERGGVVIMVPGNFNSGLEVSGSDKTPIVCKGSPCRNAHRTQETGQQMLRIGDAPAQIRATTVHGAIVIKGPHDETL